MNNKREKADPFSFGKFDVEHVLNIFAYSFATLPASALYEKKHIDYVRSTSKSFHIYLIGHTPIADKKCIEFRDGFLWITVVYLGQTIDLKFEVPDGWTFKRDGESCYLLDTNGAKRMPAPFHISMALASVIGGCPFKIKYIGQAYGADGSRDSIDRLLKHETLQKIAIKGVEEGQMLQIILLELNMGNRVTFAFLPNAEHQDEDGSRQKMGIEKLFNTTEAERVSLFEAALIRYFAPEFNKEFKDSFPSTNLKILQDCYDKDFLAITAEICFDEFPYILYSEAVPKKNYHIITYDLHEDEQRKVFFGP